MVEVAKTNLPDQPLPNLVRGLLAVDPEARLSARQALDSPVFVKFGFAVPPVTIIDIDGALPLATYDEELSMHQRINPKHSGTLARKRPKKMAAMRQRRENTIRSLSRTWT
jgi:hypothetical protein